MLRTILIGAVGLLTPSLIAGKTKDFDQGEGHRVRLNMKQAKYNKYSDYIDRTKSFVPKKRFG